MLNRIINRNKNLNILYFLAFILAVSTAFPSYIQSSFIEEFVGLQWVGLFFVGAMLLTFFAIVFFPGLIKRFTNYRLAVVILILNFLAILFLVLTNSPYLLFIFFILFSATIHLVWINMDVFLESYSLDPTTGRTRGIYFTSLNLGWLITPILMGYLIGKNNYRLAFIVAALLLIPVLIIIIAKRRQLKDHCRYKHGHIFHVFKDILKSWNLKGIFLVSLLLHFFFFAMNVYMPIYLNQYIGFSWFTIGIIFTFMLLPFVLLEIPAGIIADKYLGEKEILIIAFFILIAASALFFFVNSTSAIIWALILFLSRCGAALVEIMRETYFFKIIDVKHIDFINFLRISRPLGFLIGAGLGTLLLSFFSIQYIFIFIAIILISGVYFTWRLKDTK